MNEPQAAPRSAPTGSLGIYAERVASFREEARRLGRWSRAVSNLRGLAFVVGLTSVLMRAFREASPWTAAGTLIGFGGFVILVIYHVKVLEKEDFAFRMLHVNRDAVRRAEGRFAELPDDGARFASPTHAYSDDLDLFGPASLFQLISVARTRFGEEALAGFLREPAEPDVIRARQAAARGLADKLAERQELEALALASAPHTLDTTEASPKSAPGVPPDPEPLLAWAEGSPRFTKYPGAIPLALVLPAFTVAALLGASFFSWPSLVWAVPLLVQIGVIAATRAEVDRVFGALSSTQGAFLRYGPLFERLEKLDSDSSLLAHLRHAIAGGPLRPSQAMRRFERVLGWFELRHNGLVHPFVNALLLWDLNCVLRLERWQETAGARARAWFVALGEFEALSSLSGLSYDQPLFAWPDVREGPAHFEAQGLAHPLLPPTHRVRNDVLLGGDDRALLVTGSNMSGKSTWLRAMGVAAVLAQAGGPVCAASLTMSRLSVRSSVKISDSLARGVSHFYAEVARLKSAVDATSGPLPVFFLLDEVLHGTNSEERQIGARWVIAELLRKGAIGAVSTHDSALCNLPPELMDRVVQCHFRESVDQGAMTFDHRLRPGPVQGGNALRLMRLVGLPVPLPPLEEGGGEPGSSS